MANRTQTSLLTSGAESKRSPNNTYSNKFYDRTFAKVYENHQ